MPVIEMSLLLQSQLEPLSTPIVQNRSKEESAITVLDNDMDDLMAFDHDHIINLLLQAYQTHGPNGGEQIHVPGWLADKHKLF